MISEITTMIIPSHPHKLGNSEKNSNPKSVAITGSTQARTDAIPFSKCFKPIV